MYWVFQINPFGKMAANNNQYHRTLAPWLAVW